MSTPIRPDWNTSLFEQTEPGTGGHLQLSVKDFDAESAEGELRLRLDEIQRTISELEEAKVVTQTMLETVMSV